MPADFPALQARYRNDFPEHRPPGRPPRPARRRRSSSSSAGTSPGTSFLRGHLAELERTPFDGCVFHVDARTAQGAPASFTWLGWGRRAFSADELEGGARRPRGDRGAATRFRHNFLRFNMTPADLDWFDDHAAVVANARLAAGLARAGHCPGILLDTEQYEGKLFDYRKQRDAAAAHLGRVRRPGPPPRPRGHDRLPGRLPRPDRLPDVRRTACSGSRPSTGKKPLAECRYGLLVPFLDGMIEAARGRTRIVDGHELSYGYRDAAAFIDAHRAIAQRRRHAGRRPAGLRARRLRRIRPLARLRLAEEGVEYRGTSRRTTSPPPASRPPSARRSSNPTNTSGSTPRRPDGGPTKGESVALPPAYVDAIRRVRTALAGD